MLNVKLLSFYDEKEYCNSKYALGSMRIGAYICDIKGLKLSIEPVNYGDSKRSIINCIEKINFEDIDVLGLSAYVWTWDMIKEISKLIDRKNNITIIVGGPEVLNREVDDWVGDEIFVYGEGENFIREVCLLRLNGMSNNDIIKLKTIDNSEKINGKHILDKNCSLKYNKPLLSYKTLRELNITDYPKDFSLFETTRGCPYKCGYCGHKTRSKIASFDSKHVEEEIKFIGHYGIKKVFIIDPILGGTPQNGKNILLNFLKYAPNTEITAYLRPEYIDDEYIEILNKSNIEELRIGVQSTNENIPKWIRSNDVNKIFNTLPKLAKHNIGWRAELIIGLPGDDMIGLKNSIKFVLEVAKPSYLHAYPLTVLQETKLWDLVDNYGKYWIKIDYDNFRALECYSYTEIEMYEMVKFSMLITALYNSYAYRVQNKTYNIAPPYEVLERMTNAHLNKFQDIKLIHYNDCVRYWKSIRK